VFSIKSKADKPPSSALNPPTDGDLLSRAAAGEESAFGELYQRYATRIFAYFLARLNHDAELAEDLRQQVFLQLLESKAYEAAGKDLVREDLSSLLFTIAANLLKNTYRSRDRRQKREVTYQQLNTSAEVEFGEAPIDPAIFQWAKAQLSEDQQLCLRLRFQRGMSIADIAALIGKPEGTVKSRLHYGLEKLRNCLNDQR
jgi:RNA polymerase sigma-70 factor (ECF subfamily)